MSITSITRTQHTHTHTHTKHTHIYSESKLNDLANIVKLPRISPLKMGISNLILCGAICAIIISKACTTKSQSTHKINLIKHAN